MAHSRKQDSYNTLHAPAEGQLHDEGTSGSSILDANGVDDAKDGGKDVA